MSSIMKNCAKKCGQCKIMCKKIGLMDCYKSCNDCEMICQLSCMCNDKVMDDSLKKALCKIIIKACTKCIKDCSKHDYKECKECVKACKECIKMCKDKY